MDDKNNKKAYTVDHANKQSDAAGFDPYKFWLSQVRRSGDRRSLVRREDDADQDSLPDKKD